MALFRDSRDVLRRPALSLPLRARDCRRKIGSTVHGKPASRDGAERQFPNYGIPYGIRRDIGNLLTDLRKKRQRRHRVFEFSNGDQCHVNGGKRIVRTHRRMNGDEGQCPRKRGRGERSLASRRNRLRERTRLPERFFRTVNIKFVLIYIVKTLL